MLSYQPLIGLVYLPHPIPTFKVDAFRFRLLLSLLLSESESLSILSLATAAVTAVTVMTALSSSSSLLPAVSASGASLSEELTGWEEGAETVSHSQAWGDFPTRAATQRTAPTSGIVLNASFPNREIEAQKALRTEAGG